MGLSRKQRILLTAVVAIVLGAFALIGGGGWYLSNLLRDGGLVPDHEVDPLDLEVISIGSGRITLGAGPETDEDGRWIRDGLFGLERANGYDQEGEIESTEEESEVLRKKPNT